jgi:hypothetical protein
MGTLLAKEKDRANRGGKETNMKTLENSSATQRAQAALLFVVFVAVYLLGVASALALDKNHPAYFLPEERKAIYEYYHRSVPSKGLPPGLAKKGKLPPGLQKHLDKTGKLPPGLQKRLEPLPRDLEVRLPQLPEYWERVILQEHVVLIDRRTQRILDIIENVVGLATDR